MRRPRKPVPPNTVTVRPFVATMTQNSPVYGWSVSLLAVEEPIRAIERPINLARHDEVVLMQSFDLLGAQRDSSIAPAEADVRVMAFCLGKVTNFHEETHSMDDACTNWAEEFFSRMRSAEIGIPSPHCRCVPFAVCSTEVLERRTTAVCRTVSKSTASQLCL